MKVIVSLCASILLLAGCSSDERIAAQQDLAALAREYLFLELSMGMHDEAHVDAYFGPEEIRRQANEDRLPLDEIGSRARQLEDTLRNYPSPDSAMEQLRLSGLLGRLAALRMRISLAMGEPLPFDQETESLFGAVAPDFDDSHFEAILAQIDQLLGGEGPLPGRVVEFQSRFVIPPDRLSVVFDAALAECRRRTVEHITLPADESFSVEYVTDKPWSGYNWYQGDAHSLIQVNTDLPIYISRAVDLGCHEGYPGHHTFNALLEKNLVQDRGWLEFSIYPLFSPQSLIAEGSGNYGIELAFPGATPFSTQGTLAASPVTIDHPGVDVVAVKPASRGQGLIARLHTFTTPLPTVTLAAPGRAIKAAVLCDTRERDLEPLELRDGLVHLTMPGAIATVRLLTVST